MLKNNQKVVFFSGQQQIIDNKIPINYQNILEYIEIGDSFLLMMAS